MPSSAPRAPKGTPKSTANGIDQLSYCAASTRNTITRPSPKTSARLPAAARSWNDCPEYADAHALGSNCSVTSRSISLHHLARAATLLGGAGEKRGAEAVEPEQLGGAAPELGPRPATRPASSPGRGRARTAVPMSSGAAELRLRLRLHPEGPAVEVEVVDVQRGEERLQRAEQFGQADAARLCRGPVYVEIHLGTLARKLVVIACTAGS